MWDYSLWCEEKATKWSFVLYKSKKKSYAEAVQHQPKLVFRRIQYPYDYNLHFQNQPRSYPTRDVFTRLKNPHDHFSENFAAHGSYRSRQLHKPARVLHWRLKQACDPRKSDHTEEPTAALSVQPDSKFKSQKHSPT